MEDKKNMVSYFHVMYHEIGKINKKKKTEEELVFNLHVSVSYERQILM